MGRYHQVPEQILGGRSYHAADVHQWVADVSTQCLKKLKSVANGSAGFKYIGMLWLHHANEKALFNLRDAT